MTAADSRVVAGPASVEVVADLAEVVADLVEVVADLVEVAADLVEVAYQDIVHQVVGAGHHIQVD